MPPAATAYTPLELVWRTAFYPNHLYLVVRYVRNILRKVCSEDFSRNSGESKGKRPFAPTKTDVRPNKLGF